MGLTLHEVVRSTEISEVEGMQVDGEKGDEGGDESATDFS